MKTSRCGLIGRLALYVSLATTLLLPAPIVAEAEEPSSGGQSESDENVTPASFNAVPPTDPPDGTRDTRQRAFQQGIEEVRRSGLARKALSVGDKAVDFELPSAGGTNVRLSELLAVGPVVLTFYRGGWCPFCNRHLQGMQEVLLELHGQGGQLVAISPELSEKALITQDKNQLAFPILSDKGNAVARQYGIVFRISDKVIPYYDDFFDIEAYNGDRSYELPLAATYVIGRDGVIRYAFLEPDYKLRADPQDVLNVLVRLRGGATAGDE
jgi:peroxiredoxin